MKARFLVALILGLLGVGVPLAAVKSHGMPWGFRDRTAVVLHTAGAVELFSSGAEGASPSARQAAAGVGLHPKDELRVGVLSMATLRFPTADVDLHDGARVTVDEGRVELARGSLAVVVGSGALTLSSEPFSFRATLTPGRYRALSDGRDLLSVVVLDGRIDVENGDAARAGDLLLVERGGKVTRGAPPAPPTCAVGCRVLGPGNAIAEGELPRHAMGWMNGTFVFGDARSKFSAPLALEGDVGSVVLFVRDVVGNTCKADARCAP